MELISSLPIYIKRLSLTLLVRMLSDLKTLAQTTIKFYWFLHAMNADASTYGAVLLGALCASGFVSHFLTDWDTPLTLRRQTLRHRYGAVRYISEAFPVRRDITEESGTFLCFSCIPKALICISNFKVVFVGFENLLWISIPQGPSFLCRILAMTHIALVWQAIWEYFLVNFADPSFIDHIPM